MNAETPSVETPDATKTARTLSATQLFPVGAGNIFVGIDAAEILRSRDRNPGHAKLWRRIKHYEVIPAEGHGYYYKIRSGKARVYYFNP